LNPSLLLDCTNFTDDSNLSNTDCNSTNNIPSFPKTYILISSNFRGVRSKKESFSQLIDAVILSLTLNYG